MTAPTNQGRSVESIMARAVHARRTGRWPAWTWHTIKPGQIKTNGWASQFTRIAENGVFSVLVRDVETAWGTVRHAMITTPAAGMEPTWGERQRIKNELLGRERTAVEVFPAVSELVDGANAYHLWVMPEGMALPFTLNSRPDPIGSDEVPDAANDDGGVSDRRA